jgi:hypothetical protein
MDAAMKSNPYSVDSACTSVLTFARLGDGIIQLRSAPGRHGDDRSRVSDSIRSEFTLDMSEIDTAKRTLYKIGLPLSAKL